MTVVAYPYRGRPAHFVGLAATTEGADEEFLTFGMASKIGDGIHGIGVRVIGPPTIEQYPDV